MSRIDTVTLCNGWTTRILDADTSLELLRSADVRWRLFPNGRIIASAGVRLVYRMMDNNFRCIVRDACAVVGSFDASGSCRSLSFSSFAQVHNGFLYTVHYFADVDVMDIANHVRVHLSKAVKLQTKSPLLMRLDFSSLIASDDVTRAITALPGFCKTVPSSVETLIFERERKNATVPIAKL